MEIGKNPIGNSFIIQHFSNAVWTIHPEKLKTMSELIVKKFNNLTSKDLSLHEINESLELIQNKKERDYLVQREGKIAILNIEGVLIPKASWLDAMCGFVSTFALHVKFKELMEDGSVEKIVLYFDSPGGEVTGVPEFTETIYQARDKKEVIAFTDYTMTSGAFYLASAASKIVATPSSVIGSIGVYMALIKEKPEDSLYDVHYIQAGDNKLFGASDIPVSNEEIEYFREKVDKTYDNFVKAVSKNRNISEESIKNTKASFYDSADAPSWMVDVLADAEYVLDI